MGFLDCLAAITGTKQRTASVFSSMWVPFGFCPVHSQGKKWGAAGAGQRPRVRVEAGVESP